jgi:hypothetical protein
VTNEHRLLFEPSDIQVIELVCDNCGASVSLKPSDVRHFTGDKCPNCDEYWYSTENSKAQEATRKLIEAIHALADTRRKAKVAVRLHVRPDDLPIQKAP